MATQDATGRRDASEEGPPLPIDEQPASSTGTDRFRALALLRRLTSHVRHRQLARLHEQRQAMFGKLREIPARMQKLTNQVRLLLDLVDDYWEGRYREVRWYSLAIAVAAALYFLSPSDLIPDTLPGIGHIDDVLIMALALRLLRRELAAYCRFKGLEPSEYF
ncbi:MAG: DUF1232 domain-containing protein [Myxococcales bacterium]|nr:DUF1232 domain-containing protein [Myxococcales bacterium]